MTEGVKFLGLRIASHSMNLSQNRFGESNTRLERRKALRELRSHYPIFEEKLKVSEEKSITQKSDQGENRIKKDQMTYIIATNFFLRAIKQF